MPWLIQRRGGSAKQRDCCNLCNVIFRVCKYSKAAVTKHTKEFARYQIRKATLEDRAMLEVLIARSARELSTRDYTPEQVEGALQGAFGVDTQLIEDGTYFAVESRGAIVGCGGWSRRRTLFGGDKNTQRDSSELNPLRDAAKIRAFFVDPAHARKGVGRMLLEHCEAAAQAAGFSRFELMATLPGEKLYKTHGYVAGAPVQQPVGAGLAIEFVPMSKGGLPS
jgi:GNAT superfamily N-acetyltransferase